MEEELAAFVKTAELSREIRRGPLIIREARLSENPAGFDFILAVSGVGKVLTAAAVQFCIDRYSPAAVINTGIAGALTSFPPGDILVAEGSLQWDFDARPFVSSRGKIPGSGIREIPADPEMLRAVTALRPKGFRIHPGRMVTGDTVVTRKNDPAFRFLTEELRADAVDMECAAAAVVSEINGVRFLGFKVISDNADGDKPPLFRRFVRKSSEKSLILLRAAVGGVVGAAG
jgi:adenosylhomocysteine nucleosidase